MTQFLSSLSPHSLLFLSTFFPFFSNVYTHVFWHVYFQVGSSDLVPLLLLCCRDDALDVRQSALALLGDTVKNALVHTLPHMHLFLDILATELVGGNYYFGIIIIIIIIIGSIIMMIVIFFSYLFFYLFLFYFVFMDVFFIANIFFPSLPLQTGNSAGG